jgi:CubicO group peptidase (beta-lactamase class C family)
MRISASVPTRCRSHRHVAVVLTLAALLVGGPAAARGQVETRQPDLEAIDRYIAAARTDWNVPGMAVAIVKDGRTIFARGYGVRDLGREVTVGEHTLFAIASNTKAFTAAALAILVDEGRLSWDDRVRDHLPWFQLYDPYVSAELRVRDLLSHRSGLGTYSGDLVWYGTHYDAAEVVRRVRHLPQASTFRGAYGYSNVMFIAAGEVVRAVTGEPWEQFTQRRIIDPLGMRRTVFSTGALAGRDNVATPHGTWRGELRTFPWEPWEASVAAGGIVSSVADMAEWLKLQLRHGVTADGQVIFRPEQSATMWTMHMPVAIGAATRALYPTTNFRGYGLGWALSDYHGRMVAAHGGAYDGMYSRVALVPSEGLGVVVLTNSMTGIPVAVVNRVLDAFLTGDTSRDWSAVLLERERDAHAREMRRRADAVRQTAPGTKPSLPLASYAGLYGGNLYGDAQVSLEDGRLVLRLLPAPSLVADLEHLQQDTFVIRWRRAFPWFDEGTARFVISGGGVIEELRLHVPNEDFWFEELDLRRRPAP